MEVPGGFFVGRPGDAEPRLEAGAVGGIGLGVVAEPVGEVKVGESLPVILIVDGVAKLKDFNIGIPGDVGVGRGRAVGSAIESVDVLLDSGKRSAAGGDATAKSVSTVEVGVGVLDDVDELRLDADFDQVGLELDDGVVDDAGPHLVFARGAEGASAEGGGAGDRDLRRGGVGSIDEPVELQPDARLVHDLR
jgi:hypothetical protein